MHSTRDAPLFHCVAQTKSIERGESALRKYVLRRVRIRDATFGKPTPDGPDVAEYSINTFCRSPKFFAKETRRHKRDDSFL